ncbi:MAG: type I 3-dehydroquinate dehydratase, partial [Candidatus Acidiferrales bacterium]
MARALIFEKNCVCGVVAARTADDARRQFRRALRYTDTVELRFDWFANAEEIQRFLALLKKTRIPRRAAMIATCRRREAGGRFLGAVAAQLSLLRSAMNAGCNWIDLEIESVGAIPAFALDLYTSSAKRIVSYHDFRGTPNPSRLARVMRRMKQIAEGAGCDAIKIATQCDSLSDSLRFFALARQHTNVIAVPMGDVATPARILAPRLGSALSYAPVEQATAPGQIPLGELHELYRGGKVTRHTRVYGVIGNPIAHSFSPVLHNAGFRARKIDAIYLPFRVLDLTDFLQAVEPLGIAGFSITLPYKEKIFAHLDRIDPLARSIGATNTVVVKANGKLFGYNTDSVGVLRALEGRLPPRDSRVLILGAGG